MSIERGNAGSGPGPRAPSPAGPADGAASGGEIFVYIYFITAGRYVTIAPINTSRERGGRRARPEYAEDGMLRIGYHVSSAGGYLAMAKRAAALGANTFAFFTRNPRGGAAKAADPGDAAAFLEYCAGSGTDTVVAHAPYTLNPCALKENVLQFARTVLAEDLERMELTPGQYYNFHPGSHVGQGADAGVSKISAMLNEVLFRDMTTTVLLETMAGKGSEVGGSFGELRRIIDSVTLQEKVGVCLDTCHVWDAGYDIEGDLDGVLEEFDRVIGLERLKAVHLNNSLNPRGSRKDRHARLFEGEISRAAVEKIVRCPAFEGLPFILETPNDDDGYAREIAAVKGIYSGEGPAAGA